MPTSTDINLPKSRTPVFPDRCVACGVERPGATYRASTNAIGWWTVTTWSFGPRFTAEVPACDPCRGRMRRQRFVRAAGGGAVMVAAVCAAMALLQWYQGPLKRWLVMGVALAGMAPLFVWEALSPRPFDLTAFSETVDYEFRDAEYAREFAALNGVAPGGA